MTAVASFDKFTIGEVISTPSRVVSDEDVSSLVSLGGYTHPMFNDPGYAKAASFGRIPLPGEAVLLLMGGLVEQTERFDETTIALVALEEVRFKAPAFAGDTLSVEMTVKDKRPSSAGRTGTVDLLWRCLNGEGETLVEATARMLFRLLSDG